MVVNALRLSLNKLTLKNRAKNVVVAFWTQLYTTGSNTITESYLTQEPSLSKVDFEPTDHTVFSLRHRLAETSTNEGFQKTEADFSFINQNDVDNWNDFMRLSNEYHSVRGTERQTLIKYMGDPKTEYSRCIRGKDPRPECNTTSWEEFWQKCQDLTAALWSVLDTVARLRLQALKSPMVSSGIERGLFSIESWDNHVTEITNQYRSMLKISQLQLDLHMYSCVWKAERERYARNPENFKLRGLEDDYIVHLMGYEDEKVLHERKMMLYPVYKRAMIARQEAEERRMLASAFVVGGNQHSTVAKVDGQEEITILNEVRKPETRNHQACKPRRRGESQRWDISQRSQLSDRSQRPPKSHANRSPVNRTVVRDPDSGDSLVERVSRARSQPYFTAKQFDKILNKLNRGR